MIIYDVRHQNSLRQAAMPDNPEWFGIVIPLKPQASSIKAIRTEDDAEFVTLIYVEAPLENAA